MRPIVSQTEALIDGRLGRPRVESGTTEVGVKAHSRPPIETTNVGRLLPEANAGSWDIPAPASKGQLSAAPRSFYMIACGANQRAGLVDYEMSRLES